ncbi:MAG: alginate export family protein [Gammaproteobacteria bacterium]|nr:alginate export family protein [Gammaproteobacteria bacterium]
MSGTLSLSRAVAFAAAEVAPRGGRRQPARLHISAAALRSASAFVAALTLAPTGLADSGGTPSFADAVRETRPALEIRYRHEAVDQDGIDKDARALTAKARLSWIMPAENGFSVGVEGDYVFVFPPGIGEDFNSTENGHTEYPVVADPTGFDLNQAFLRFRHDELTVTAGRQRIVHAGQRFVGAVGWRQNEQTFDALRVQSRHGRVALDYSFVANVNRIFGPGDGAQPGDWKGDSHLFRGDLALSDGHSLGAFAYLLDFENDNGPPNSTATYGLDYRGGFGPLTVSGSVARQTDWARSPLSYRADYYALEARLQRGRMAFAAGYEVLASDGGRAAFRTPLATLHKFQGWTDKFLGTPPAGIEDAYVTASTTIGGAALTLALHDFNAERGGDDYGREVGLLLKLPVWKGLAALVKFAHYDAQTHASDTNKFWVMLTYRFGS